MTAQRGTIIRCVVAAAFVLDLAGCAAGASPWAGLPAVALLAGLIGLLSCSEGTKERCCARGKIVACECPPRTACNYGQGWKDNGDGTCSATPLTDAAANGGRDASQGLDTERRDLGPDGPFPLDVQSDLSTDSAADASEVGPDGRSEPCCDGGRLSTCYCSPLAACSYAPFRSCGDGTCYVVIPGEPDAGDMCRQDASGQ